MRLESKQYEDQAKNNNIKDAQKNSAEKYKAENSGVAHCKKMVRKHRETMNETNPNKKDFKKERKKR